MRSKGFHLTHKFTGLICILGSGLLYACNLSSSIISATPSPTPSDTHPVIQQSVIPSDTPEQPPLSETTIPTPTKYIEDLESNYTFQLVSGMPQPEIMDIWVSPTGDLWLAAGTGLFTYNEQKWEQQLKIPADDILGLDGNGTLWVIIETGNRIAAYQNATWDLYDDSRGWETIDEYQYLYPDFGDGLVTTPDGDIWFATGTNDLRHFNRNTAEWESLTAEAIGFSVIEDDWYQGHYLTDVALAADGSLYVSNCIGEGEGFSGNGIRRFVNGRWQALYDSENDCIMDMEVDSQGRIWAGAFDKILLFDTSHVMTQITLPPYERRQVVAELSIDPSDDPWLFVLKYGGASIDGGQILYQYYNNGWINHFEPDFFPSTDLAFTSDGTAWFCDEFGIWKTNLDCIGFLPVSPLGMSCQIEADNDDHIWLAAQGKDIAGLWQLSSNP